MNDKREKITRVNLVEPDRCKANERYLEAELGSLLACKVTNSGRRKHTPRTQRSPQHSLLREQDCSRGLHAVFSVAASAAATAAAKATTATMADLKNCIVRRVLGESGCVEGSSEGKRDLIPRRGYFRAESHVCVCVVYTEVDS